MPLPRLVLLTTDACTLCERALDLLTSMPELRGLGLDVVDIVEDELLVEQFGELLPVLTWRDQDGRFGSTLMWPFDAISVSLWLRELEQ